MRSLPLRACLILCALVAAIPARAQPNVDDATRSAAATLGQAGLALYKKGDYTGALAKFDQAEQLVQAPTLGVRAARCLEKLGRLVDAAERYQRVIGMTLDASWPEVHRQAQRDAVTERAALLPRIPSIEVVVEGARPGASRVTVDGKEVADPK